ncbi:protein kinase family protein [Streptomyces sp. ZYX-F-203]
MADRRAAAVDVADNGDAESLSARADESTTDSVAENQERDTDSDEAQSGEDPTGEPLSIEVHSGHKLARRYRLEECVTRLDGFSSWRAVDEMLRRAVGVHVLPRTHPRARAVLAAARSSALLGDPRFVMVLDAVEENDLVYVVHEWLPDATELTTLLASGPLDAYDADQMVGQVAAAMAAAHREGLAHLRLSPNTVLRAPGGQWRIRGLAVNAALRGIDSDTPQASDTEAIGALLYASLTQRWPYESDAYGLSGLPKDLGLIPPDQVRAGVHRGLSELAMRALANHGATASRHEAPCTTPEELVKAIGEMPRLRPPEPKFTPSGYQRTTYQQGSYGRPGGPAAGVPSPVSAPPPLQSRTGRALKWSVSALLIAALGLGSWQLAEALMERGGSADTPNQTQPTDDGNDKGSSDEAPPDKELEITSASEFAPSGTGIQEDQVPLAVDGKPSTAWITPQYRGYANFGNLSSRKEGSGIIVDLGEVRAVTKVDVDFYREGQTVEVLAADEEGTGTSSLESYPQRLTKLERAGDSLSQELEEAVKTRYLLVRITSLPTDTSSSTYRGGISEIKVYGS